MAVSAARGWPVATASLAALKLVKGAGVTGVQSLFWVPFRFRLSGFAARSTKSLYLVFLILIENFAIFLKILINQFDSMIYGFSSQ
jgi:hypothetical protein